MLALAAALAVLQTPLATRIEQRLTELHKGASFPGMTAAWTLPNGTTESIAIGLSDKEANRKMLATDRILAGSIVHARNS